MSQTFTLGLNKERGGKFCESFIGVPRSFLNILKEEKLLKNICPQSFPETFNCEIIVEQNSNTPKETCMVSFYTDFIQTKEMREHLEENESINMKGGPEDCVWFSIILPKNSIHIAESDTRKKIVLSF